MEKDLFKIKKAIERRCRNKCEQYIEIKPYVWL